MIFWVNAHGAFVLGLALLGFFTAGEVISRMLRQDRALSWHELGLMAGIGVLTALATLINPHFAGIVDYVTGLMTDVPSQSLIEEWQSPTPAGIASVAFYISVLLLFLVFAYTRYRPTPTEAILLAGFLWLAWSGQRYVIWFGMVAMPLFAKGLAELPMRLPSIQPQRNLLNSVLAVLLFVPALLVQPWWVERVPLPESYWSMVWREVPEGSLLEVETPVGAADYLAAHPGGHLFNEMGYGSYLIWALPEQKVFIDPRVELYPYDQWMDYVRIGQGVRYNELLREYGADRVLLSIALQKELSTALEADPFWEKEYEDVYSEVWVQRHP
jgi:hypothetical protein